MRTSNRQLAILAVLWALCAPAARAQEWLSAFEIDRRFDSGSLFAGSSSVALSFPIEVGGAPWMQLVFAHIELPERALLRVTSVRDGRVHEMDAENAARWSYRSAYMNGDALVVEVLAEPGAGPIRVVLDHVVVGAPPPQASTCGLTDERALFDDARIGRVLPVGCTAWLVADCNGGFLSAGHCFSAAPSTVMFHVPLSAPDGTPQMSAPENQYPIDPSSSQHQSAGVGADWWYFGCFANSNTGATPIQREAAAFALLDVTGFTAGATLRVTGYGFDTSPPQWNDVSQTATGPWTGLTANSVQHQVDTQGGNSGSPVVLESTGAAIAIHTHAGCTDTAGSNQGTRIGLAALQAALATPHGVLACAGSWSTYCTPKVNSQGCTPVLSASANPSFSGGPGRCLVTAANVLNNQNGIFFYGTTPAAISFQGGTLCVSGSIARTGIQSAGGNPPPADCSGTYTFDLGARIASGLDPRLVTGATIVGQFWSRDPLSPSYPSGLTGGIRLTIGP